MSFDLIDSVTVSFDLIDNMTVSFDLIPVHGSAGVRGSHAPSGGSQYGGGGVGRQLGQPLELEGGGQRGGRGGLGLICQVRGC